MGYMIDGEWHTADELDGHGDREREPTQFRDRVADRREATDGASGEERPASRESGAEFPAEAGRYHLYISRACPWAHGAVLVRKLTGLEDSIELSVVDPYREDDGWTFTPDKEGCTPDRVNGFDHLREVYAAADPDYTGRVSVPVLYDTERDTIVNNESIEVMRMLDDAFAEYKQRDVTLYPEGHREEVDALVDEIYGPINTGVYRAGFADTQAEYESAVADAFDALDHWEDVLDDQRYLAGERLTLADLRLFATLVRFDAVYHTHFKVNVRRIADYENLHGFLRDIYQLSGVPGTVNVDHVKEHYYRSHDDVNPKGFVPVGPELDFEAPHDRDRLPGGSPEALQ